MEDPDGLRVWEARSGVSSWLGVCPGPTSCTHNDVRTKATQKPGHAAAVDAYGCTRKLSTFSLRGCLAHKETVREEELLGRIGHVSELEDVGADQSAQHGCALSWVRGPRRVCHRCQKFPREARDRVMAHGDGRCDGFAAGTHRGVLTEAAAAPASGCHAIGRYRFLYIPKWALAH